MKKVVFFVLCILATTVLHAQSWKTNADQLVVKQLFASDTSRIDIFSFPEILTSSDSIVLVDGTIVHVPYSNCYGYFINLMPMANWSHPCEYCFVNASLGNTIITANMPPENNNAVAISLHHSPSPNPSPVLFDTTFVRNCKSTDTSHKWAVLISGCGTTSVAVN